MKIKRVYVFSKEDFRKWLESNHDKEKIVELIVHKKHTGKPSPSHRELMDEGICYGWIDTVIKRVDEDKFIRTFQRRNEKSSWSQNTLSYARQLIRQKRMSPHGLKFYNAGRKKKAFDEHVPKNPEPPRELLSALNKSKRTKDNWNSLTPSAKKTYLRWLHYPKTEATKKKRIEIIMKNMSMKKVKKNLF